MDINAELNLMIESKIEKQIKNKIKDLENKKMTETLYSEKCSKELWRKCFTIFIQGHTGTDMGFYVQDWWQ